MPERVRALGRVVAWTLRAEPWRSAAAVSSITLARVAMLGAAYGLKLLVDAAATQDVALAVWAAALAAGSAAASRLLAFPVVTVGVTLRERAGMMLERRLMGLVAGMPGLEHHERPEYLDELELVRQRRGDLGEAVASIVDNIADIALLAGTVVLLVGVHPLLVLLPLSALVPFAAAVLRERQDARFERDAAGRKRLARRLHELTTSPRAGMELRLFGLGERLRRTHNQLHASVERERLGVELRKALTMAAGDIVFFAAHVAAVVFIVVRAVAGEAAPGDVLLTVVLAQRISEQVTAVIEGLSYLLSLLTTVGRLRAVTKAHDRAAVAGGDAAVPEVLREGIAFADVWFRYPGTEPWVLRGASFTIPAGGTVAIVGDNGAGKTSICKLLLRFYEPTRGRITVDGVDLDRLDPWAWRARTAAAFQDLARLELLMRESVGVGDVARIDEPPVVRGALERAGGEDIEAGLPEGLESQLGRMLGEGAELSGGEWQKVALGRTMMRGVPGGAPPLLLVLDEPTASLDAGAEHRLFARWARAASEAARETGAVTVFVSHRFSTVRMADRIIVVDDGGAAEIGTHDELMARGGRYAELYTLQARAYR